MSLESVEYQCQEVFKQGNTVINRTSKEKGITKGFTQVDNVVIKQAKLGTGARLVLIYLLSQEDITNINQQIISEETGLSLRSVNRYVAELKKHKYLEVKTIPVNGRFITKYTVNEGSNIIQYAILANSKNKVNSHTQTITGKNDIKLLNANMASTKTAENTGNKKITERQYGGTINKTNKDNIKIPPISPHKNPEKEKGITKGFTQEQKELEYKLTKFMPKNTEWLEAVNDLITNHPLPVTRDWLEAIPFYGPEINHKPWYLYNSVITGRNLPELYLKAKSEDRNKKLLTEWSGLIKALKMPAPALSNIENRIAELAGELVESMVLLSNYRSGDIDFKAENNQKCRFALDTLKIIIQEKPDLNDLVELIKLCLDTPSMKQRSSKLRKIILETKTLSGMVRMIPGNIDALDSMV